MLYGTDSDIFFSSYTIQNKLTVKLTNVTVFPIYTQSEIMYPRQVYSEHIVSQCDECCVCHVDRPAILLSSHNLKQHTPLPIAKGFFSGHLRPTMRWTFRPYRDAAARLVCVEPHFLNEMSRLVYIPEYTFNVHYCSMVFFKLSNTSDFVVLSGIKLSWLFCWYFFDRSIDWSIEQR